MFSIPGYLLERIYVQDSLENTEDGFKFAMRNVIESGTLSRIMAVEVDGEAIPLEQVSLVTGEKVRPATEVTPSAPLHFPVGSTVTVKVSGKQLDPGEHKISVRVNTWEAGPIAIPVKATLQ
ncbi:MAG: hypothetical protein J7M34_14660 [Anaerolineae bacterium]|nr:hypothetical protein [Anaerolineae bacterium]